MSSAANPKSKGGKAPANANNDEDSIMPLLFATIGNPSISFKKMAAMDELGRSESSFEHKFRKWRQKGREIAAKNPAHAGSISTSNVAGLTTKKPRASAKKGANVNGKRSSDQAGIDDKEIEDDDGEGTNKMGRIGGEKVPSSSNGKAFATNSTKKRAVSLQVDDAEQERDVSPVTPKKAKVVKKGTALVVKKTKAKVESGSEEEDAGCGDEEKVPTKPTGERKANITAAQPTGTQKAKQVKDARTAKAANARQIHVPSDDEADVDMESGGSAHNDMVDMQFDLAA